jgi:hypothetical protein
MTGPQLRDKKESVWSRIKKLALTDVGALVRGLNAADLEKMERILLEAGCNATAGRCCWPPPTRTAPAPSTSSRSGRSG